MTGIQIILLTGVVFISLYFFIRWKKRLLDILLLSMMVVCAIVFIVWPDTTQIIAKKLGVGRGADLVFYICILIFWFVVLKLYSRVRYLEHTLTELIRRNVLQSADQQDDEQQ